MSNIKEEIKRLRKEDNRYTIWYILITLTAAFAVYFLYLNITRDYPEKEKPQSVKYSGDTIAEKSQLSQTNPGGQTKSEIQSTNVQLLKELIPNALFSLTGALIAVIIGRYLLSPNQDKKAALQLLEFAEEHKLSDALCEKIAMMHNSGLLKVFADGHHYLDAIYESTLHAPAHKVIIVDSWISDLKKSIDKLSGIILKALGNGNEVIFVLMHPNSPLVDRRQDVLISYDIKKRIEKSVAELKKIHADWIQQLRGNRSEKEWLRQDPSANDKINQFKVYLSDAYLSLQLYSLPGIAYCGFYVSGFTSTQGPHLAALTGSPLGDMMRDYAKRIVDMCQENKSTVGTRVRLCENDSFDGVNPDIIHQHIVNRQLTDLISGLHKVGGDPILEPDFLDRHKFEKRDLESLQMVATIMRLSADDRRMVKRYTERFSLASDVAWLSPNSEVDVQRNDSGPYPEFEKPFKGYHMTREGEESEIVSEHIYNLSFHRLAKNHEDFHITGTFTELKNKHEFRIEGELSRNEMWLVAKSGKETSVGLIKCGYDPGEMHGWYIAHDYNDKYIITSLLLTTSDKVTKDNARTYLQKLDKEFASNVILAKGGQLKSQK